MDSGVLGLASTFEGGYKREDYLVIFHLTPGRTGEPIVRHVDLESLRVAIWWR